MTWGIKKEVEGASWGARAIHKGSTFSLVWDRQSMCFGGDEVDHSSEHVETSYLKHLLNEGVIRKMMDAFSSESDKGSFRPNEWEERVLYEDDAVTAYANCNASHGYLYICVVLKKVPDWFRVRYHMESLAPVGITTKVQS